MGRLYVGIIVQECDDFYYADYENFICIEADKVKCYDLIMEIYNKIIKKNPSAADHISGYKIYEVNIGEEFRENYRNTIEGVF